MEVDVIDKEKEKKKCPVCKGIEFYPTSIQWGLTTPDGFKGAKLIVCANPKCNIVLASIGGQTSIASLTKGSIRVIMEHKSD